MKYIFIINPAAGKDREKKWLLEEINKVSLKLNVSIETYFTKGEGDAKEFARKIAESGESARLYACGGDGTLNEVVNGVGANKNIEIGCVPCGTGNDFVKNFADKKAFLNIEKQILASVCKIDMIEALGKYSVNILNLGFDANVADSMQQFKRLPLVSGSMSYSMAVVKCVLGKIGFKAKLVIDDKITLDKKIMLMAAGNGICYGGGYYGCPDAKIDDGLLDLCVVNEVSRLQIADLIKYYKAGTFLGNKKFDGIIDYIKCKKVVVEADEPFNLSHDGEISSTSRVEINVLKGALKFCNPMEIRTSEREENSEGFVCQR